MNLKTFDDIFATSAVPFGQIFCDVIIYKHFCSSYYSWIYTSLEGAFSIKEGRWASKTNHSNDESQFACKMPLEKRVATFISGDLARMTLHRNVAQGQIP